MKKIIVTTEVYLFDELSDSAKETAIQAHADCNVFDQWFESEYDDAETIGLKITAFDLNPISCSGEWIEGADALRTPAFFPVP